MKTVEILRFDPTSGRAAAVFAALIAAAAAVGLSVRETHTYAGAADWLLLWGPGAPNRQPAMRAQLEKGGRVIAWDLAYWDRDRQNRVAFDGAHPARDVMRREWPASRWTAARLPVQDTWDAAGPVVVAGIGPKAYEQYGAQVTAWETATIAACRARWANRPVIYREKKALGQRPDGATSIVGTSQPIERQLAGASLCVTWHSNVAIDAIRMGIPVICRDGAAAAVCQSALGSDDPEPLAPEIRERFLRNLAWFQWAPSEAVETWRFIAEALA